MVAVELSSTPVHYESITARKRLGLILLSSDLTTERDYARLMPLHQVAFYSSRVKLENPITPANLAKMESRLTDAATLFPEDHPPTAICYSCTSASVVIGDQRVTGLIQTAWPDVPVVTPTHSAVKALQALNAKRISILTPYTLETSQPMADYFRHQGLNIQRFRCLGVEDDRLMARIQAHTIIEAACDVDTPTSEAIFISCTALPALDVITQLEKQLDKPVVTSNQVTAWAMLHYARAATPTDFGRLFQRSYPE